MTVANVVSGILLGFLLAPSARAQNIRAEDIVRYLQPGRWDIEVILIDPARLTEAQRKKFESSGGAGQSVHSTDCLDANGKSAMLAGIEGADAVKENERKAKQDCKSTLTPLGPREARIVISCNSNGRAFEVTLHCRYTTLEVSRTTADGRDFVFKKAHRTGDCK